MPVQNNCSGVFFNYGAAADPDGQTRICRLVGPIQAVHYWQKPLFPKPVSTVKIKDKRPYATLNSLNVTLTLVRHSLSGCFSPDSTGLWWLFTDEWKNWNAVATEKPDATAFTYSLVCPSIAARRTSRKFSFCFLEVWFIDSSSARTSAPFSATRCLDTFSFVLNQPTCASASLLPKGRLDSSINRRYCSRFSAVFWRSGSKAECSASSRLLSHRLFPACFSRSSFLLCKRKALIENARLKI